MFGILTVRCPLYEILRLLYSRRFLFIYGKRVRFLNGFNASFSGNILTVYYDTNKIKCRDYKRNENERYFTFNKCLDLLHNLR